MNTPDNYDTEGEHLNKYSDLLSVPKTDDQVSASNSMVLKTALWTPGTTKKTKLKVNFTPDTAINKKTAAETMNQQVQAPQLHCRSVLDKPTELGVPGTIINRTRISVRHEYQDRILDKHK